MIAISLQRLELKGYTQTINFAGFAMAVNLQICFVPQWKKPMTDINKNLTVAEGNSFIAEKWLSRNQTKIYII